MIVYYGEADNNLLIKPTPVLSLLEKPELDLSGINKCPSFADYYKNVFAICATFDYSLDYKKESAELRSRDYDQGYFNDYVLARDLPNGIFSYLDPKLYLVPDADDVMVELLNVAYPFDAPKYSVVPGVFNLGRHIRPFELAMQVKEDTTIEFRRGKPLYLIRFKTNEKIIFKRFNITPNFMSLIDSIKNIRQRRFNKNVPLNFYYKLSAEYKLKKQFLKITNYNLVD